MPVVVIYTYQTPFELLRRISGSCSVFMANRLGDNLTMFTHYVVESMATHTT